MTDQYQELQFWVEITFLTMKCKSRGICTTVNGDPLTVCNLDETSNVKRVISVRKKQNSSEIDSVEF